MAIDFNTDPYYDDYSESDQFYRILFKPGRAVQARELTQIQTLLQKQVERFGKNIFKEGSIVLPGSKFLDTKYRFVKLTNNTFLNNSIIGQELTGQTSGVTAVVLNFAQSENSDEPTIFVKYRTSGTGTSGNVSAFTGGEQLRNLDSSVIVTAKASNATGTGTAFNINSGVIFVKGHFVYFDDQTIVLEKYTSVNNLIVGFDVTESFVTSEDEEGLLDPALSSTNYLAPGADRYKISLTLNTRAFTPTTADDPDFVELIRIENGAIIRSLDVQYNILADTLARRTFDESGDYVVNPFRLEIIEHLRTSNVQASLAVLRDGVYEANANGNSSLFVSVVSQGKAYIKGFEVDSLSTRYINFLKARDTFEVNNGTISTPVGNFIEITSLFGVPDITNIATVSLRDTYTTANGSPSGNQIGTAKVRGMEYSSGTVGATTSEYKLYLFDINVNTGKTFERNVKQIYFNNPSTPDFTANVVPSLTTLTGTAATITGNIILVGTGTLFDIEVLAGDVITLGSTDLTVSAVNSNTIITLSTAATSNITGLIPSVQSASIIDATNGSYIFSLPYNIIKTVDTNNVDTTYKTRRAFVRTLSAGATTLTAGTGETFAGFSLDNYQLVFTSGADSGDYINLSGMVVFGAGNTTATITIPTYTTESVYIIATINKSLSAADRKVKTINTNQTVDFLSANTATAASLSLGVADVYQLKSVRMSANAYGSPYFTVGELDITDRYTLDNGQKTTFYDVGRVTLKPGRSKPTSPVRVTFDFFTHGVGDYFSVESYASVGYDNIPTFTTGGKTISLRDVLDFRPRNNNAGTGFTGTGAVLNEFIDHEDGLVTNYEYYLPRIDKLVIDSSGRMRVVEGVSSLTPKEPATPDDSMPLYVLSQKAYVFDAKKDIDVKVVDNRRYTMRDIGKIENRVKNLEYYTQLSLLERDTEQFQIKDAQGFDRFKNGFVVDPFRGHGIGDPTNEDYSVAIDSKRQLARPLSSAKNFKLLEAATTTGQRASNNYVLVGDIITLPFTEEVIIENSKASIEVNLNPFDIVNYVGTLKLDPAVDNWFDFLKLPDVYKNEEGNYDTLIAGAKARGTWGTVWGAWNIVGQPEAFKNSKGDTFEKTVKRRSGTTFTAVEVIDTTTYDDVIQSVAIIPKMRDVSINFKGEGLKPNTLVFVYFDEIDITNYCRANVYSISSIGNAQTSLNTVALSMGNLITDFTGMVEGSFPYQANVFNLNNGVKNFRLVDSSFNGLDFEMVAEAAFTSGGELRNVATEVVSTRNARIDTTSSTKKKTETSVTGLNITRLVTSYASYNEYVPVNINRNNPRKDFLDVVYQYAFGREPDPEGKAYWRAQAAAQGINTGTIQNMTVVNGVTGTEVGAILPDGSVSDVGGFTLNESAKKVATFLLTITNVGIVSNNENSGKLISDNSIMGQAFKTSSPQHAAGVAGVFILVAVANQAFATAAGHDWASDMNQAFTNGI